MAYAKTVKPKLVLVIKTGTFTMVSRKSHITRGHNHRKSQCDTFLSRTVNVPILYLCLIALYLHLFEPRVYDLRPSLASFNAPTVNVEVNQIIRCVYMLSVRDYLKFPVHFIHLCKTFFIYRIASESAWTHVLYIM